MNISKRTLTSFLFSIALSSQAWAAGWNQPNNPELIAAETGHNFEYNFNLLPKEGALSQRPWTDDYWPTYKRGLASRWQGDLKPVKGYLESAEDFEIRKKTERYFTENQLRFMNEEERNKLSPAEKYDIINRDFSYTLTKSELSRTKPDAPKWEGICHGWAAAAMLFKEPDRCKVGMGSKNIFLTGAQIPFASSDVKALLSLMQGNYNPNSSVHFAGTRCNSKESDIDWARSQHENDINAGAFHVILANRIGKLDQGFVFDRTKDAEVWNQPVEGYRTRVIKESAPNISIAAKGAVKEVEVESVVDYTIEVEPQEKKLNDGDRNWFVTQQPYHYILELDAQDKIIGGRWISKSYPDFVWTQSAANFRGQFKNLEKVYKKSLGHW